MHLLRSVPLNIIGAGSLVLLAALVYLFGWAPAQRAKAQLEAEQEATLRLESQSRDLKDKNVHLRAEIESRRRELLTQYNSGVQVDRPIVETVSLLLNRHQLELENLRKIDRKSEGVLRVDLQVTGRYRHIVEFLDTITRMSVPACINRLRLQPIGDRQSSATVTASNSGRENDGPNCTGVFQFDFYPDDVVNDASLERYASDQTL
ncbi:MAG TPA: hypothetical protein DDW52_16085 [Planctomycetaceae bacterium]|nr:hypothetical protein [Planctomycetaceae bacterium]